MKLSVFYDHILEASEQTGKSLEELLGIVVSCGIGAIEIRLSHMEEDPDALKRIQAAGLKISSIFEFYDMGVQDESAKVERHLAAAKEAGSPNIMIVPGFMKKISVDELKAVMNDMDELSRMYDASDEIAGMVRGLKYAVKRGSELGINVLFEDFDDYTSPMSGSNGVMWFLQHVPGIKHAFDCGNYIMYEEDVPAVFERMLPWIAHVHCKDRSSEAVAVGDGYIPIATVIERLLDKGYDGYFTIEHFGAADHLSCIRRSAEYIWEKFPTERKD